MDAKVYSWGVGCGGEGWEVRGEGGGDAVGGVCGVCLFEGLGVVLECGFGKRRGGEKWGKGIWGNVGGYGDVRRIRLRGLSPRLGILEKVEVRHRARMWVDEWVVGSWEGVVNYIALLESRDNVMMWEFKI